MKSSGTLLIAVAGWGRGPGRRRPFAAGANRAIDRAHRGGRAPVHRDFQPDVLLERRGRLHPHRLDDVPEGPRDHRRHEHPAGQGIAADPGKLSGWRVLGDARGQSAKAGHRAVVAGAGLRAVPVAGSPQGLGFADPSNPGCCTCRAGSDCRRVLSTRDRPPGLPAGLAASSPAASGSIRSTAGRRRRAWS